MCEDPHLPRDLSGRQVPNQSHFPGQTERASHGASDLRRNAERLSRGIGDEDGLDLPVVGERQHELLGAVFGDVTPRDLGRGDSELVGQLLAQGATEVGHAREIGHASLPDPTEDLAGVKPRVAVLLEERFELGQFEFAEVSRSCAHDPHMISFTFNPFSYNELDGFPNSVTEPRIRRETLANGLRLVTEAMPHVRSVSIGVWLTRGSRHEPSAHAGIAHFVEHMLFKGTSSRSAEDIAQQVDSIGGQLDAFTSKEYAGYYVKVLDEHLPAGDRHSHRPRIASGVRARRDRAREKGRPRRDQDGRGHTR